MERLNDPALEHDEGFVFVQMADPQFGAFASLSGMDEAEIESRRRRGLIVRPAPRTEGFSAETVLYERAIAAANRIAPDFVVVCGDMVNDAGDADQLEELWRITRQLDDGIPVHWVAGNHDLYNRFTTESLAMYRQRFGEDNYSFEHRGSSFIVLNSSIFFDPSEIRDEWERQLVFLRRSLEKARGADSNHIIVFTHHPFFVKDPEEDEDPPLIVVPRERRRVLLDLLLAYGVSAVFAGHWHRNNYASYGRLQMVTSGSVGYPLGYDRSGIRVVRVFADRIEHEYVPIDDPPTDS